MRVMGLVVTVVTTAQGVMAQQVSAAAVDVLFAAGVVAGAVISSSSIGHWLGLATRSVLVVGVFCFFVCERGLGIGGKGVYDYCCSLFLFISTLDYS